MDNQMLKLSLSKPRTFVEGLLSHRFLIYVPAYNCETTIEKVLRSIPLKCWEQADVLVINNCSADNTSQVVEQLNSRGAFPRQVILVQPHENLGYSGSQKLAYKIALESTQTKWVIMLHGDGQYPTELIESFFQQVDESPRVATVYGYRDKQTFPKEEETPDSVYWIIRTLSWFESLCTGVRRREWHSGFVMYSTRFLKRVDLDRLTDSMHIDGHLQYAAAALKEESIPIPIYKKYRELNALGGWKRITYVLQVLWMCFMFRFQPVARRHSDPVTIPEYTLLSPAGQQGTPIDSGQAEIESLAG